MVSFNFDHKTVAGTAPAGQEATLTNSAGALPSSSTDNKLSEVAPGAIANSLKDGIDIIKKLPKDMIVKILHDLPVSTLKELWKENFKIGENFTVRRVVNVDPLLHYRVSFLRWYEIFKKHVDLSPNIDDYLFLAVLGKDPEYIKKAYDLIEKKEDGTHSKIVKIISAECKLGNFQNLEKTIALIRSLDSKPAHCRDYLWKLVGIALIKAKDERGLDLIKEMDESSNRYDVLLSDIEGLAKENLEEALKQSTRCCENLVSAPRQKFFIEEACLAIVKNCREGTLISLRNMFEERFKEPQRKIKFLYTLSEKFQSKDVLEEVILQVSKLDPKNLEVLKLKENILRLAFKLDLPFAKEYLKSIKNEPYFDQIEREIQGERILFDLEFREEEGERLRKRVEELINCYSRVYEDDKETPILLVPQILFLIKTSHDPKDSTTLRDLLKEHPYAPNRLSSFIEMAEVNQKINHAEFHKDLKNIGSEINVLERKLGTLPIDFVRYSASGDPLPYRRSSIQDLYVSLRKGMRGYLELLASEIPKELIQ